MNTKFFADRIDYFTNNDFIYISIALTEEGFNSINEIIKIVNKYIDIIKEEGYKKEYFNNFVHIQNSNNIIHFRKDKLFGNLTDSGSFIDIFFNYLIYGDKLFAPGMISEDDYNEELLKKYLNALSFEKSFYSVNCETNIEELDNLDEIFKSKETMKLKYYNSNFILGLINDETEKEINDKSVTIPNLTIRGINEYVSTKYNETVIPCYKEQTNTCKEKNEFDYEKEDQYKGTLLEENENYITFYQIDKSSESHLVYSSLIIYLKEIEETNPILKDLRETYINYFISNFIEIDETFIPKLSSSEMNFEFITFSDNTQKIINKFIDSLVAGPTEEDFEYLKIIYIYSIKDSINGTRIDFQIYTFNILQKFKNQSVEGEAGINLDEQIEEINNITYEDFKDYYLNFFNYINSLKYIIAGNIDENLVSNIHSNIKKKFTIKTNKLAKKQKLKVNNKKPSVYNYYQKSTLDEAENAIIVSYEVPDEYLGNINIFIRCFQIISMNYLRFNYTNVYTPQIGGIGQEFLIYEQGLYKDVDQMEDDINSVLKDVLDGKIDFKNYKEIIESTGLSIETKNDKSIEKLFSKFKLNKTNTVDNNANANTDTTNEIPKYPETFKELVEIVSPIFTNPNRITILIAKKDLSDEAFEEMFQRRSKITEYPLNKNITIIHTNNITAYEISSDEN
jgi:secreted Zn-dependent insulinase-like peptidase